MIFHVCFGHAYVSPERPAGYAILPDLGACLAEQISIEAAQPRLDRSVLREISGQIIRFGVLDLGRAEAETA